MKITPIRMRRINAGFNSINDSLLDKLKISKSTFYKLEQGCGGTPSAVLIKRIADTYGCTTDDIFKDLKITG
ncbi:MULTISPECIES: helix-turn-helix transcriptional regulator [Clostridium]|uniref:helix-turn-helix domain-containing protein n=1 Tax=Clostridium TaxID=1485 RepID=UPI0013F0237E|nr:MULTISPECIES: helix-turn-helix transcriptional regulator [Clostridium]MBY6948382.1 helix-turn-helix transcriptional regulator [Clostridium botulinum]MBY7021405.1 helix-turn-helix transcriptional regulator [Clostridium botulinum]NFE85333.1 helix-turn-helix transcriptional regulator [Clostridium botulinum]NFH91929.1 helix-turn-helix transcriptional regulator [Clostridium botulinum]NFI17200.1 helix-turn-helix transcriptional regulator [Clostridium botulinum]